MTRKKFALALEQPSKNLKRTSSVQEKVKHSKQDGFEPKSEATSPTDSNFHNRTSRDQLAYPDSDFGDPERANHPRQRKMADMTRLSNIYPSMTEDISSENPSSSLNNFSKLMANRMSWGGEVNPAYLSDDDEDDDDAKCNSESEDDLHALSSESSGSLPFVDSNDYNPVPNGHAINQGRDFRVGFSSFKERAAPPPPPPSKPKEKKVWDRFTTADKDNFSSDDKQYWDRVFVLTKLVMATLLFFLTLVTAVISKICFVIISANMLPPRQNNSAFDSLKTANKTLKYYPKGQTSNIGETNVLWIWAMISLIGAPYFFTFCRNFWKIWIQLGSLGSPSFSTIILVLLIETIHSIGLIITVFVVVPNLDPISGLLMTLCMGVIPGFLKVIYPTVRKAELKEHNQSAMRYYTGNAVNFIGAIGQLAAIAAWCYHVYTYGGKFEKVTYIACVILAPILMSLHWWENFVHEGSRESKRLPLLARHIRKSKTKLTFYASLWKMVLIILIPMALYAPSCGTDCVNVLYFKKDRHSIHTSIIDTILVSEKDFGECNSHLPIVIAAIGVLCSGACFKIGKIGCKIMTQVVDYSLPLVLSTPVTVGVILGMYQGFLTGDIKTAQTVGCTLPFPHWINPDAYFSGFMNDYKHWTSVIAGLLGFFSILVVTNYIWYPGKERLLRTDKLFVQPLYCGVMTDISLMLNRRRIEKVNVSDSVKKKVKKQRAYEDDAQINLQDKSVFTDSDTPIIYMCATMWHETENEMTQLLKSVFRMDEDQCTRKNTQYLLNRKDPDYYEFEAHIFFDDAFEKHDDDQYDFTVNEYVKLLIKTVQFSASAIIGQNYKIKPPVKIGTPYGGRLVWTLPGGNKLIAHLKDKTVIRHRKRWSQVMYMYYFLAHQLFKDEPRGRKAINRRAKNTYLLALDGDVDFYPNAVQLLVDRMKKNTDVGAACGRIHPIGNGAMVWYQKFEYAVSHWLQKAAEDKLGCVLCSPGCFSLFRGSALMDENVMNKYTTPPTEPRHHVQYDQGEDRWLCTLMLQQGHRVEYCAASDALTYAPEGFYEFFKQRRRWMPSTMANIMDLLTDWKNVTEKNSEISLLYVLYQGLLLVSSILTPGTIFLMILGAINMAYPAIDLWWALVVNGIPIAVMIGLCFCVNDEKQLTYAAILSTLYSLVMMVVIVGLLVQAAKFGICSVTTVFISFVGGVFVLSALIHPQEFWCIIHGFLYFLAIPSMSMILMIYSLGNLHVVTWGTRENKSVADKAEDKSKKKKRLPGFLHAVGQHLPWASSGKQSDDDNLRAILTRLDGIENQISRMSEAASSRFSDRQSSIVHRSVSPYLAGQGNGENFSQINDLIVGAGERENPMYAPDKPEPRNRLVNPYWMKEDQDFSMCKADRLDDGEVKFWEELIEEYLKPLLPNVDKQAQMAADLIELRNKVCLIFILVNSLFIIIVFTLQQVVSTGSLSFPLPCADPNASEEDKNGQSIEPISVAFTLVFGLLLFVQFICMLMHRMATLLHICASTEIFKKKRKIRKPGLEETGENDTEEAFSYDQVYEMVRDMQKDQEADSVSIASESSYAPSDVDEEEFDTRRREAAKARWKRIAHQRSKVTHNTLHANFIKNVDTLTKVMSRRKDGEVDEEDEATYLKKIKSETKFNRFRNKSLHVLATMSRDKSIKEQLAKRKARKTFQAAGHMVVKKKKFSDVVAGLQVVNERDKIRSEEIEMENRISEGIAEEGQATGDNEATDVKTTVMAGEGNAVDSDNDSMKAEDGRDSSSTTRDLTDEELQIHIPTVDDGDTWPDEDEYAYQGQTPDTDERL